MNESDIKDTFQDFKHGTSTTLNKKSTLTRKENYEGQEIYKIDQKVKTALT